MPAIIRMMKEKIPVKTGTMLRSGPRKVERMPVSPAWGRLLAGANMVSSPTSNWAWAVLVFDRVVKMIMRVVRVFFMAR